MEVYHNRFSRVVPGKSSLLNGTVFRKKVWSSLGDYFFTLTNGTEADREIALILGLPVTILNSV